MSSHNFNSQQFLSFTSLDADALASSHGMGKTQVLPLHTMQSPPQPFLTQPEPDPDSALFVQQSHNYSEFRQQTSIPFYLDNSARMSAAAHLYQMNLQSPIATSAVADPSSMLAQPSPMESANSFPSALLSPSSLSWDNLVIDDSMSQHQQMPMFPMRVFPGMHQQMASQQQKLREEQLAREANQEAALVATNTTNATSIASIASIASTNNPDSLAHASLAIQSADHPNTPLSAPVLAPTPAASVATTPFTARLGRNRSVEQQTEHALQRAMNDMRNSITHPLPMPVSASSFAPSSTLSLPHQQSHSARLRKNEDDMDDDERLLNSAAGKLLPSKERRQLRNKVSARAFRSRRKEYISQLEDDLAKKSELLAEANHANQALQNEIARLNALLGTSG